MPRGKVPAATSVSHGFRCENGNRRRSRSQQVVERPIPVGDVMSAVGSGQRIKSQCTKHVNRSDAAEGRTRVKRKEKAAHWSSNRATTIAFAVDVSEPTSSSSLASKENQSEQVARLGKLTVAMMTEPGATVKQFQKIFEKASRDSFRSSGAVWAASLTIRPTRSWGVALKLFL